MAENIIDDKCLRYMEANTLNYAHQHRYMEASVVDELYFEDTKNPGNLNEYSWAYLNAYNKVPSGNMGIKMVSGVLANIGYYEKTILNGVETKVWRSPYSFFHFTTSRKLYDLNETMERVKTVVQSLKERALSKRKSIEVYVNGKKVPDTVVFVYASNMGTDVFIPCEYFIVDGINNMSWVMKDYSDGSYMSNYDGTLTSGGAKVIGPAYTRSEELTPSMISLYIGGVYIPHSKYTYTLEGINRTVQIQLTDPSAIPSTDTYGEVIVDVKCKSHFTNHYVNSNGDLFIFAPKNATLLTESAIFIRQLAVYIEGLRIPYVKLAQKTYRHITYTGSDYNFSSFDGNVEMVVSDRNVEFIPIINYRDSFMEFEKWVTEEEAIKALSDDDEDLAFNPPISYADMSFPPKGYYDYDITAIQLMSNEERVLLMLRENHHYIMNLLRYIAGVEDAYKITIPNGTKTDGRYVDIQLDRYDDDEHNQETRMVEPYVGELKIDNKTYSLISKLKSDVIRFPMGLFPQGETTLTRIYKTKCKNNEAYFCKFNTGENEFVGNGEWQRVDEIPGLTGKLGYYELDDLYIYQNADNSDGKAYFIDIPNASVYFSIIPNRSSNYELRKVVDENNAEHLEIKIPEGSTIEKNRIVYISNARFHSSRTYKISQSLDNQSTSRLVLNNVYEGEVQPLTVADYTIKVFLNGKILVPDKDYFLTEPANYSRITCTVIIFRVAVKETDVVDVLFMGIKAKIYANYTSISPKNKYGFIYFSRLDVPFSMDYLDLYMDGIKLTEKDVTIYSDRLVKINKKFTLPYIDVVLYSRFSYNHDVLKPYLDVYNQKECEFDSYVKRFCKNFIYDEDYDIDNSDTDWVDTGIDEIFQDSDGIADEDKSEAEVDPNKSESARINPFMNRVAYDYATDMNRMSKYVDSNKDKDLESDDYRILLNAAQRNANAFIFDANSDESSGTVDFIFNCNKYCRLTEKQLPVYYDILSDTKYNNKLDSNRSLLYYTRPLLARFSYPSECEPIDSNYTYEDEEMDGLTILDANRYLGTNEKIGD